MHEIEPFYNWEKYYNAYTDMHSPFFRRKPLNSYENTIYGYYIHPDWDEIGSETLYVKLLFVDYEMQVAIIELLGEWNDALHNDIMHLKRVVIDSLVRRDIKHFMLIGENILNFHASDDCYYEEWFEDVEDGWIAGINFRDFVEAEWTKYHLDYYMHFGGTLHIDNWRTLKPKALFEVVRQHITRRLI